MFLCQLIIVAAAMGQATQSTGAEGPRGPVIRVSLTDDMINDPLAQGLRVRPRTEVREHGDSPRAATTQPSAGMAPTTRPATNTPTTQPVSAEPNRGSASPVAPRMTVAARPALMDMENDLLDRIPVGHQESLQEQAARTLADVGELSGDPIEVRTTESGDLILYGSEDDLAMLEAVIEVLDRMASPVQFQMFELKNAQAATLAPEIMRFWNTARAPATGPIRLEDRITIIPNARSNMLMIAASATNLETIADIVGKLDQPSLTQEVQFQTIQLQHINAAEAQQQLGNMLDLLQRRRQERGQLVDIVANLRLNQLLVSASQDDFEQIKKWVEQIDVDPVEQVSGRAIKARFFFLKKAAAKELAPVIEKMLEPGGAEGKEAREQIRRLQIVFEKENIPALDLEKPIKLDFDDGANAILVTTVESNLEPIGEIIRLLDTLPIAEEMAIKIYPLLHADAEELATRLQNLFSAGQRLPVLPGRSDVPDRTPRGYPGEALAYNVALAADRRTNTLVVAGQLEQLLVVSQIVDSVDKPGTASKFSPRMIKLEHADVRRVAEFAQKLADQWQQLAADQGAIVSKREQTLVIPDLRTNMLIVSANEENFEELRKLAMQLDEVGKDYGGDINIITLDPNKLTAADLSDKIGSLWDRRAQQRKEEGLPEDRPVIVTDNRSNALIIAASVEDFQAIENVIKRLEQQKLAPMADIRTIELTYNSAGSVGRIIQDLWDKRIQISLGKGQEEQPSDRVAVVEEPLTNTLLVASTKLNYDEIVEMVKKLDKMPAVEGAVRSFPVKNADVSKAAELIENMFQQSIYRGTTSASELPEAETKISIVADARSSSLIVSASPQNFAIVEFLLREIDQSETPLFQADARFYPLRWADVVSVADILTQLFDGMKQSQGDLQDQYEITVIPDSRSNVLIVAGSRFAMQKAETLIPNLDREPGAPTSDMRVYILQQASAPQLQQVLSELFDNRSGQTQKTERTPVTIMADEGSNTLIVNASQEDHVVLDDLVRKLDQKSTLAQHFEVIPLLQGKAQLLADTLEQLLQQRQRAGAGQGQSMQVDVAITPETRTNALLVWAPPGMMGEIRQIVAALDNNMAKTTMGLQVVTLLNSKAQDMADMLDSFFEKSRQGQRDEAQQLIIKFMRGHDEITKQPIFDQLVYQDVTVEAYTASNSLVLMAPEDSIAMMGQLIKMLDGVQPMIATIREFPLYNANATDMMKLLEELFQTQSSGSSRGGEEGRQLVFSPTAAAAMATAGGAAIELTFSVDERTNTLIAAGSEAYLAEVANLVYQLDERQIDERIVEVRRLQNARANDVASAMKEFFDSERQILEEAAGGAEESAMRRSERQVSVTSVEREEGEASILLVSYSPRLKSQIESMIAELDQPPPQVMIQVLMAEVTLNNNFEMGMEFAFQDLLFSEKAYVGNNNVVKGKGHDWILGTDLGAAPSGVAGFSFTLTGEDFNFLLRALQTEGRLEVLSRPAVLVRDGQEATISVGDQVPVVKDATISGAGQVTPTVSYEDVGIELLVTPIINPDGFVNMKIAPSIRAIGTSNVTVATGITLPIFTNRSVETAVTVKDGETIVIGGLIKTETTDEDTKVPLAGDIPILGNLFRTTSKSKTKTELLIVLTPRVIRTVEDARRVSMEMRDQTGMMDKTRTSPLMNGLQVEPEADAFGPDLSLMEQITPANGEELGPQIETKEFGPAMSVMELGPAIYNKTSTD
ncbi:MAG: hypothetical protein GXY44_03770 [Phycisphaerales bacterium]|nr:hypothetical protein [Phycisphaerales bacterium]